MRWFSTPSPWGEGGAHAPGEGEIPVLAGNREDLAVPPHPPLRDTFSPGRRRTIEGAEKSGPGTNFRCCSSGSHKPRRSLQKTGTHTISDAEVWVSLIQAEALQASLRGRGMNGVCPHFPEPWACARPGVHADWMVCPRILSM